MILCFPRKLFWKKHYVTFIVVFTVVLKDFIQIVDGIATANLFALYFSLTEHWTKTIWPSHKTKLHKAQGGISSDSFFSFFSFFSYLSQASSMWWRKGRGFLNNTCRNCNHFQQGLGQNNSRWALIWGCSTRKTGHSPSKQYSRSPPIILLF